MPLPPALLPFRHGAFARFWFARLASMLGLQIQATVIGWQVYDLARSTGQSIGSAAFLLGLVGLVQFGPLFLLSLIGGQAADRYDRKAILIVCYLAKMLLAALLALVAGMEAGMVIPIIFVVGALSGALNAFLPAASQSLLPRLVPRQDLPRAIGLMSLAFQAGAITGPAIGGIIYALNGSAAYGAAAALIGLGALLIATVKAPAHVAQPAARTWAMIAEGLRYIRGNPIVLGAISLDFAVVILAGATALLPVFARDILHVGAEGMGLLRSSQAAGAALVAILLVVHPIERRVGYWMFGSVAIFGLATIVFGLSSTLWLSMLALAVAGGSDMISVFVRQSLVQLATPDEMRGRVSSVSFVFISASNELGEFESGVVARLIGAVPAVLVGGAGAIIVAILWARLFPQLVGADRFDDTKPVPIEAATPPHPARA